MSSAHLEGPPRLTSTHALLLPDILFSLVPHLDFHSLLRCQRVCKTWASVISRSRGAKQTLFLEPSSEPFNAFKAAEEHDIATKAASAFKPPQKRIPRRPEFRALFSPWIWTHGCDPIRQHSERVEDSWGRRQPPVWRFTDRVSSGRLDFCFRPDELVRFVGADGASCNRMFLTQPPVKRAVITVQGGYMLSETFDVEKDEGVKTGDVVERIRESKAVRVMRGRKGHTDFTTVDLNFDEHFTGVRFLKLEQLVTDQFGNVDVVPG